MEDGGELPYQEEDRTWNGQNGCLRGEPFIQFPPEISQHLHTAF